MKTPPCFFLSILALLLSMAGCSAVDPVEETISADEKRLFGDDAAMHTFAGTSSNDPTLVAGEGDEVRLEEGQRVLLPAFDATLTFVEKTEDSRCAADVICVWEGAATVLLEFAPTGQTPRSFKMTGFVGGTAYPYGESSFSHEAFGLRFTLLRLDPYPLLHLEQTDPVRATLRVEAL